MAKLIDLNPHGAMAIGNDGLLQFIDDINVIRARSGNRYRFEPGLDKESGVLKMKEHLGIPRPNRPETPSPRYAGNLRIERQ